MLTCIAYPDRQIGAAEAAITSLTNAVQWRWWKLCCPWGGVCYLLVQVL